MAVDALRAHVERQGQERAAADARWSDHDLVFCTRTGAPLDAANVRREFRAACTAARIGERWTPRELRHSFVSLMSSSGVLIEEIVRHLASAVGWLPSLRSGVNGQAGWWQVLLRRKIHRYMH